MVYTILTSTWVSLFLLLEADYIFALLILTKLLNERVLVYMRTFVVMKQHKITFFHI